MRCPNCGAPTPMSQVEYTCIHCGFDPHPGFFSSSDEEEDYQQMMDDALASASAE